MKLVIDTNIVISALIKDSLARVLILFGNISLVSPEFIMEEVDKYKSLILDKSGLSNEEFEELVSAILNKIEIVPKEEYESNMVEAEGIIERIHISDVPFIACALAIDSDGIWSEDRHFKKQSVVKLFKTSDILRLLENSD